MIPVTVRATDKLCGQYSRDELGVMAPVWIADEDAQTCAVCGVSFGAILPRRHHCRACGIVVCAGCSGHRSPLAYYAYRRSRVCDNCHAILSHKSQRGLRCRHDNASPPSATDADPVCTTEIDDGLLNRNNEPLYTNVSADSLKSAVSGYLTMGRELSMEDPIRRWFELHRDGVLYSFIGPASPVAATATVLHGYKLIQRQTRESASGDEDWQFALVRGERPLFYLVADARQQLDRWTTELAVTTATEECPLLRSLSYLDIAKSVLKTLLPNVLGDQ